MPIGKASEATAGTMQALLLLALASTLVAISPSAFAIPIQNRDFFIVAFFALMNLCGERSHAQILVGFGRLQSHPVVGTWIEGLRLVQANLDQNQQGVAEVPFSFWHRPIDCGDQVVLEDRVCDVFVARFDLIGMLQDRFAGMTLDYSS